MRMKFGHFCSKMASDGIPLIDVLPDEILSYIFDFLPPIKYLVVSVICRRWHRVAIERPVNLLGWYYFSTFTPSVPGQGTHKNKVMSQRTVLLRDLFANRVLSLNGEQTLRCIGVINRLQPWCSHGISTKDPDKYLGYSYEHFLLAPFLDHLALTGTRKQLLQTDPNTWSLGVPNNIFLDCIQKKQVDLEALNPTICQDRMSTASLELAKELSVKRMFFFGRFSCHIEETLDYYLQSDPKVGWEVLTLRLVTHFYEGQSPVESLLQVLFRHFSAYCSQERRKEYYTYDQEEHLLRTQLQMHVYCIREGYISCIKFLQELAIRPNNEPCPHQYHKALRRVILSGRKLRCVSEALDWFFAKYPEEKLNFYDYVSDEDIRMTFPDMNKWTDEKFHRYLRILERIGILFKLNKDDQKRGAEIALMRDDPKIYHGLMLTKVVSLADLVMANAHQIVRTCASQHTIFYMNWSLPDDVIVSPEICDALKFLYESVDSSRQEYLRRRNLRMEDGTRVFPE